LSAGTALQVEGRNLNVLDGIELLVFLTNWLHPDRLRVSSVALAG